MSKFRERVGVFCVVGLLVVVGCIVLGLIGIALWEAFVTHWIVGVVATVVTLLVAGAVWGVPLEEFFDGRE